VIGKEAILLNCTVYSIIFLYGEGDELLGYSILAEKLNLLPKIRVLQILAHSFW